MRIRRLILVSLMVMSGAAAWKFRTPLNEMWQTATGGMKYVLRKKTKPDPKTYAVLSKDLERWRKELAARYVNARTASDRKLVEGDARVVLEQALPALMRCWLGTPWDFNGTAKGPGAGKIACGYFVATVLKDAGFRVDRYKLAKQPSENILRSFLKKDSCTLTVGENYQKFASEVEKREPGIYIVGLDTHVGFLVIRGESMRFIHSSGSSPWCVVDENRDDAGVLQRSNWRMLGNLTADSAVLKRWLNGDKIAVRGT